MTGIRVRLKLYLSKQTTHLLILCINIRKTNAHVTPDSRARILSLAYHIINENTKLKDIIFKIFQTLHFMLNRCHKLFFVLILFTMNFHCIWILYVVQDTMEIESFTLI